jgi:hypothetical protein
MTGAIRGNRSEDGREQLVLWLPTALLETLMEFCRDKRVAPELVVERALVEYFREGDMSH